MRSDDPLAQLTPREREVLGLMAEGHTNAGIAKHLWLTEKTVETHRSSPTSGNSPRRARPLQASGCWSDAAVACVAE